MRKHFYRKAQKQIIFHDTLEILEMNETATFIYENRKNNSNTEIISNYAKTYGITGDEAKEEVNELLEHFEKLGIGCQAEEIGLGSFAPHTPIVHIIQNCNSPCIMCDCWQTKTKNHHPASILKEFHYKMKKLGAQGIMISGGEPLLHPEIKTILSDLKKMQLAIYLNTNAILLNKHIEWLSYLKIEELVISMDGSNAETYRLIRGAPMFDNVWSNIKLFREKNPQTRIILRTMLTKHNAFNLEELIDLAEKKGIDHIGFSPIDIGSSSFSRGSMASSRTLTLSNLLLPNTREINDFLSIFKPGQRFFEKIQAKSQEGLLSWGPEKIRNCLEFYKNVITLDEKIFSSGPCLFPIFSMVVDYNGDLKNCFYSEPFGNLSNLNKVSWNFEKQMQMLAATEKCKTCRGKVFCDLGLMQER